MLILQMDVTSQVPHCYRISHPIGEEETFIKSQSNEVPRGFYIPISVAFNGAGHNTNQCFSLQMLCILVSSSHMLLSVYRLLFSS